MALSRRRKRRLSVLAELRAREHRRAADPVAAGGRAEEDDVRPDCGRARARDPVGGQEANAHRVDKAVVAIGLVEDRLPSDGRNADGVAVVADPRNRAAEVMVGVPEAEPVEERYRPRPHRDDVPQDPADPGRGTLERFQRRRMVVRLDLEGEGLALAEIDHAGVLAGPLQDALAL